MSCNVSFNVSFNVSLNVSLNVSFNVYYDVSFNVSFNVCFVHSRSLDVVQMRRAWSVTSEKCKKNTSNILTLAITQRISSIAITYGHGN